MKAFDAKLRGILYTSNQYIIPVFQRFYSWQGADWQRLWDSIIELRELDDQARGHFMGSLVFVPEPSFPNKTPAFQVIDGQQRLTTVTLLLCALRNVAKKAGHVELAAEIDENYLTHRFKKGREHFRVYPRQRDRESFISGVKGEGDVTGRIAAALGFFEQKIAALPESSSEDELRAIFTLIHSRLDFVHITLEGENPYQIFKSLNSTGVDLSEADLIRNFVFMHVLPTEQDDFDDQQWKPLEQQFTTAANGFDTQAISGFFRDFLMQEGRYIAPNATFESFERRYSAADFDPMLLADDLRKSLKNYDIIKGVSPHTDKAVKVALQQLRYLDSSTTYPLVLKLLHLYDENTISLSDLSKAIRLISGFIFRRNICGESSRAYGRWFVAASANLNNEPLNDLRTFLLGKGFPNDNRFIAAFVNYNFYESRYGSTVLKFIEQSKAHKEPADLTNTQIEHIMPQTLTDAWKSMLGTDWERVHEQWKHTIGNLTLTAYNQELGNKSFVEKRDGFQGFTGYRNSNIVITRDLVAYQEWTEVEIISRANKIASEAAVIWPQVV